MQNHPVRHILPGPSRPQYLFERVDPETSPSPRSVSRTCEAEKAEARDQADGRYPLAHAAVAASTAVMLLLGVMVCVTVVATSFSELVDRLGRMSIVDFLLFIRHHH